jgi:hypothetical protein
MERYSSTNVLLPGARIQSSPQRPAEKATQAAVDALVQGKGILYLFGRITYDDAVNVGDLKHHESTFCSYLDRTLERFNVCDTYNESN